MGFLDAIVGNVAGSLLGGGNQSPQDPLSSIVANLSGGDQARGGNLLAAAMSMLQQHGGLANVLAKFQAQGMAREADSWVSAGPNADVSADQLRQALGGPAVANFASQLGLSDDHAGSALAKILPELVNQLTPGGSVPDNHQDMVSQAMALLRRGVAG